MAKRAAGEEAEIHPLLPDPDEGEVDFGDIRLGTLSTGGEVRIPVDELLLNTIMVAPPAVLGGLHHEYALERVAA